MVIHGVLSMVAHPYPSWLSDLSFRPVVIFKRVVLMKRKERALDTGLLK